MICNYNLQVHQFNKTHFPDHIMIESQSLIYTNQRVKKSGALKEMAHS